MAKKPALKTIVHEIAFQNEQGEYLDATYHIEGYIDLQIDTSQKFSISTVEELDLIYAKLKEILTQ
jgi:hypothetical protein